MKKTQEQMNELQSQYKEGLINELDYITFQITLLTERKQRLIEKIEAKKGLTLLFKVLDKGYCDPTGKYAGKLQDIADHLNIK